MVVLQYKCNNKVKDDKDEEKEWDIAALIPYEYFIGATKNKVYADSRKKF